MNPQGESADLIEQIAARNDLSKSAAGRALDSTIASISEAVANGDTVYLVDFGTFKGAARTGKNLKTSQKLDIAATTVPKFSAGAPFKAAAKRVK